MSWPPNFFLFSLSLILWIKTSAINTYDWAVLSCHTMKNFLFRLNGGTKLAGLDSTHSSNIYIRDRSISRSSETPPHRTGDKESPLPRLGDKELNSSPWQELRFIFILSLKLCPFSIPWIIYFLLLLHYSTTSSICRLVAMFEYTACLFVIAWLSINTHTHTHTHTHWLDF